MRKTRPIGYWRRFSSPQFFWWGFNMDITEAKTAEWHKVRSLWQDYVCLENVESGYNPDAVTKARSKFYAAKAKYEKAFSVKWHEDDLKKEPPTPSERLQKVQAAATVLPPIDEPAKRGHNNPPEETPEEEFRRRMAEDHVELITEAEKLAAGKPKPCEDDAYADRLTTFTQKLTKTIARIEEVRKTEKAPILKQGAVIDSYFNGVKARLEATKLAAKASLDPYLKRKAAEEQRARVEAAAQMQAQAEALAASQKALYDAGRPVEAGDAGRAVEKIEKQAERLVQTAQYQTANVAQVKSASGASASLRTRTVAEITSRDTLDLEKLRPYFDLAALQKALDMFVKTGGREIKGAVIKDVTETVVR